MENIEAVMLMKFEYEYFDFDPKKESWGLRDWLVFLNEKGNDGWEFVRTQGTPAVGAIFQRRYFDCEDVV